MNMNMPVHNHSRDLLLRAGHACPESWPFAPFATPEAQAWCRRNHSQSAETLASRGWLSPAEALAIIEGYSYYPKEGDDVESLPKLTEIIRQ